MNDKKVLLFLGSKSIVNGRLFEIHQIGFLKALYKNSIINYKKVIVTIFTPSKMTEKHIELLEKNRRIAGEFAEEFKVKLVLIPVSGKGLKNINTGIAEIVENINADEIPVIFAQNYYCGLMAEKIKNKIEGTYFHLNLRGVPAEEELFYSDTNFISRLTKYFILKIIEKRIFKKADSFSVVSNKFRDYLISKFKIKKDIIVYPCVYDKEKFSVDHELRKKFREKYGIKPGQTVIMFSGSMRKWQMPEKIFQFFRNIYLQDNANFVFLFLTIEKMKALEKSKKYKLNNLIIETAEGNDLISFYNASDISIIVRKNDIVNYVASPTKIAEYLATGNVIIMTEGIGDYSALLKNKKFSIVCKNIFELINLKTESLKKLSGPDENDLKWIEEMFSSESHIQNFKLIFDDLN